MACEVVSHHRQQDTDASHGRRIAKHAQRLRQGIEALQGEQEPATVPRHAVAKAGRVQADSAHHGAGGMAETLVPRHGEPRTDEGQRNDPRHLAPIREEIPPHQEQEGTERHQAPPSRPRSPCMRAQRLLRQPAGQTPKRGGASRYGANVAGNTRGQAGTPHPCNGS